MKPKLFVVLSLIFGIGLFSYFLPGDLLTLDAHSHLARTWLFRDILTNEHQFPVWTNRWYCGFPLELYYGPFYYLLNALWTHLVGDLVFGTKLFLWGTHILSGFCFYFLVNLLTSSRAAALFSTLFFVFSPQHLAPFVEGGRHPLCLIFLFLPLTFYYYEKCQQEQHPLQKAGPTLALLLSLSLFSHLQFGIYTLFAFLSVSFPRMIFYSRFPETRPLAKYICKLLILASIFYLLFTAWIIFPAFQDAPYLLQSKSNTFHSLVGKWMPHKAARNLILTLFDGPTASDHIYYVGLLPFLLALFAYSPKNFSIVSLSYACAFLFAFTWMLFQTRYTYFSFFFLAVLSAYGMKIIHKNISPLATLLTLALAIDFAPRLRTTPYSSIRNTPLAALEKKLEEKEITGRILSLRRGRATLWSSLNAIDTHATSPFGGIPQNATLSHPYIAAISAQASEEIFDKRQQLSLSTLDLFRLLNVHAISIPDRKSSIELDGASPLWFSKQRIFFAEEDSPLERETWLTIREHYDARSFDTGFLQKNLPLHPLKIHKSKETHSTVLIDYESDEDGFGWLPYAYFPHLNIKLDGQMIPFYESAMHFLTIPLQKGRHTIQIDAGISYERKLLCLLAVATFCFSILIRFRPHVYL